jgi:hypothetical protein
VFHDPAIINFSALLKTPNNVTPDSEFVADVPGTGLRPDSNIVEQNAIFAACLSA